MSAEPYTEDVEFILDEVIRYARMSWAEMRPHLNDIAFYDLKDATGHKRPAGRPAMRRLQNLTERTLATSPFGCRLDPRRTFRIVQERFGETFLRADFPCPSEADLRAMFESWIGEAGQDCRPRVHIIPCDLALDGVERLTIGPVTLHTRKSFWPAFEADLEAFLDDSEPDERKSYRVPAAEAAREYLSTFSEVAEVEVPGCDGPTSRGAAEAALQALLDYIHVLAGAAFTARMRGPGPALGADRRSAVVRAAGRLEIAYSVRWGGANISDAAWRQLTQPRGAKEVAPLAGALWRIVERRELPLLADRFVDACGWYGDAAREASPAAAAVKYVTAMERLLWTGERQRGVTQRVAERLAALCFSTETWNFADVEAEVKDAYDLRSALLHGRISQADPDVAKRLGRCELHARELLLTWLDRFGDGFDAEVTVGRLGEYLNGFTECARAAAQHGAAGRG